MGKYDGLIFRAEGHFFPRKFRSIVDLTVWRPIGEQRTVTTDGTGMAVLAVTKIRISGRPSSLQPLLMRGNDLITLLAVMAAWRLPTRTQQAAMPMLVILSG